MTFRPEAIGEFLATFREFEDRIRGSEGCTHLELWNDIKDPNVFFTYSHWEAEEFLNAYRHSETFGQVWPKTKALFSDKAEAWSINKVSGL